MYLICGSVLEFTTFAVLPSVFHSSISLLFVSFHFVNNFWYSSYCLTNSESLLASAVFMKCLSAAFRLFASAVVPSLGCCTWSTSPDCHTGPWNESTPFCPSLFIWSITLCTKSSCPQTLVFCCDINAAKDQYCAITVDALIWWPPVISSYSPSCSSSVLSALFTLLVYLKNPSVAIPFAAEAPV